MQMSPGPDWRLLLIKRATVTGFIVSDHFGQMADFWKEVPAAVKAGKIKYREDIVQGIENAPEAFIGLLKGRNFGKLLVQAAGRFFSARPIVTQPDPMKIRSMPRKMPRTKKLEAGHWAMIITPSSRVTRPETTTQPQGLP
eukprot:gene21248-27265_t